MTFMFRDDRHIPAPMPNSPVTREITSVTQHEVTGMSTNRIGLLCRAAVLAFGLCSASGVWADVCFGSRDVPPFPIIQQAPPPRADNLEAYRYFPATWAATRQIDKIEASPSGSVRSMYWQWANHGPRAHDNGFKGNITPEAEGVQVRFSSKQQADTCTMSQTAAVMGLDPRTVAGSDRLRFENQPQRSDTLDVCLVRRSALPPNTPILLDYEVADGRTAAETETFLRNWAQFVHANGHHAILYTNPLDAPSQRLTQITAENAPHIGSAFDMVSVMLWSRNAQGDVGRSFAVQSGMYGVPSSKLMVVFELQGTTMRDASVVHDIMKSGQAGALNLWRNYAVQGGDCNSETNQKIACAIFGRCS